MTINYEKDKAFPGKNEFFMKKMIIFQGLIEKMNKKECNILVKFTVNTG